MTAPMIQNWRDVETLEAAGKLGRFLRTRQCSKCRGVGLEASYSIHDMGGDLCGTCGGSGVLPVYAKAKNKTREHDRGPRRMCLGCGGTGEEYAEGQGWMGRPCELCDGNGETEALSNGVAAAEIRDTI